MDLPGFAALLALVERGFEAVEGGFVFLAEFGGALVEAGFAGFFRFDEGEGDAGGSGGVGVLFSHFGYAGIGDDALPGFYSAEEPGFLGDAEDEEFFGGRGWGVGAEVIGEELFEEPGLFVIVEEMGAEPGLAESGFGGWGGRGGAGRAR